MRRERLVKKGLVPAELVPEMHEKGNWLGLQKVFETMGCSTDWWPSCSGAQVQLILHGEAWWMFFCVTRQYLSYEPGRYLHDGERAPTPPMFRGMTEESANSHPSLVPLWTHRLYIRDMADSMMSTPIGKLTILVRAHQQRYTYHLVWPFFAVRLTKGTWLLCFGKHFGGWQNTVMNSGVRTAEGQRLHIVVKPFPAVWTFWMSKSGGKAW